MARRSIDRVLGHSLRELSLAVTVVRHGDSTAERQHAYARAHAIAEFVERLLDERGGEMVGGAPFVLEWPGE